VKRINTSSLCRMGLLCVEVRNLVITSQSSFYSLVVSGFAGRPEGSSQNIISLIIILTTSCIAAGGPPPSLPYDARDEARTTLLLNSLRLSCVHHKCNCIPQFVLLCLHSELALLRSLGRLALLNSSSLPSVSELESFWK
jgi:hypothetical protein